MANILLSAFIFTFLLVYAVLYYLNRDRAELLRRLKKATTQPYNARRQSEDVLNQPFSERVIRPLLKQASQLTNRLMPTKGRGKLEQALQLAGNPGNLQAQEYQAINYGLIILLTLAGAGFGAVLKKELSMIGILSALGALIGRLLGKSYLSMRAKKRQMAIQKSLPDVLDLLTVSIEAGLGFDAALMRVVEKGEGELVVELRKTLQEMQVGKSRRQALRDLGERTGVEDLQAFVGSMIQADQLGVSVSKVIRVQAEQVRQKRRQRVEEKAMKAPIKMLIPLVFFIFPSIFIVLLGPAVIQIFNMFLGGK